MKLSTNFGFISQEWSFLSETVLQAEKNVKSAPVTSAFYSRLCLEQTINWLFENEQYLNEPYQTTLSARMAEQTFKEIIPPSIYREIQSIRKEGNNAVHGRKIPVQASMASLRFLFRFLSWIIKMYSENPPAVIPEFDESILIDEIVAEKNTEELSNLQEKLSDAHDNAQKERKRAQQVEEENKRLKSQLDKIQVIKHNNQPVAVPPEQYTEAETRILLIDAALREAGWNPYATNVREYEVQGMPVSVNSSGNGYVDYVLWGDNGLPLAVVEAKKTSRDIGEGKHQAELYANCLEKMTGRRPIIFYSNGYETEIWDDAFYPPRKVHGFYTKDELELLINRRKDRKDLRYIAINDDITNRYYQKMAIQNVAQKFAQEVSGKLRGASRAALLVMATGTGKTRTAISFVDIMIKANWAKRVLFLADRNALVTQAKRNFEKLLPNLSSIDLTKESEDKNTRLVFSTYPTIMNKIDGVRTKDERFYTVGHFDLIIIDEAHRSVYQKYRAIFEYFDAMMLGLTATPKDDTDHDTYDLFDEEYQVPTYNYDLDDAINDNFLNPYNGKEINLGFLVRGVQYNELSAIDKIKYEETFRDEAGNMPLEINASALNDWFYNANTIDKVLHYLMQEGIKVEGGDKIGKTIIFARSHSHAEHIERRFNKLYPQFGNKFLRIIDNYEKYAQDLIDDFSLSEKLPQIAVSVDMLDTGIDIPELVNLVLFKPVYSKSKFWQMIGRGTRLCPELFGPGQNKNEFKIFDFCGNFQFFQENPRGRDATSSDSLSAKTFKTIILISEFIQKHNLDESYQKVRDEYLIWCYNRVLALNKKSFTVKMVLRHVETFSEKARWFTLNEKDIHDVFNNIAPLIFLSEKDEAAKRFDLLILNFKLALLESSPSQEYFTTKVKEISAKLLKLTNINDVAKQKDFLKQLSDNLFWQENDIFKLETIRQNIRDLLKYIPKNETIIYESDLTDELISETTITDTEMAYGKSKPYKQKIERFIRENKQNLIINKIYHNIKLNSAELEKLQEMVFNSEIGTKDDYDKTYGDKPLCVLIRNIIGLDEASVMKEFSDFLNSFQLRPEQMEFIHHLVKHFSQNGLIELKELTKPPYTDQHDQGLFGLFDDERQDQVIDIIQKLNAAEQSA